jgi:HSP20 family molecular chaperone IbpA
MSEKRDAAKKEGKSDVVSSQSREVAPTPEGVERMTTRSVFSPAVDIFENDRTITLLADIPGVARSDVEVVLEKRTLTLRAKGKSNPPTGYSPMYAEYGMGDYERSFVVSEDIDPDNISATVRNGMLTLTLPKRTPDKRQIEIGG